MRTLFITLAALCGMACTTSSDVGPDDGGRAGSGAGSGGGGDGGTSGDASLNHDAAVRDDAASGEDAGGLAADGGGDCTLAIETGPCDGAFSRYAWDAAKGACVAFSYGGCQGNANNFERASDCLTACAPATDAGKAAAACKVGALVYPSGADGIDDPFSCNTCVCSDGQLACTEIGCPEPCPTDTKPGTSCAACGPVDNCEIVEHGCFRACSDSIECTVPGYDLCLNDVCKSACG
jgi:Kunitz/Bovine pancreatic trypsin inhibitor domain